MEENLLLQAPHSRVQFRFRLFSRQEHAIPILNESEMEKIKTWHLGFVIAMETIGFLYEQSAIARLINTPKHHIANMTKPPTTDEAFICTQRQQYMEVVRHVL